LVHININLVNIVLLLSVVFYTVLCELRLTYIISVGDVKQTYRQRLVSWTTAVLNLSSWYLHTLLLSDTEFHSTCIP